MCLSAVSSGHAWVLVVVVVVVLAQWWWWWWWWWGWWWPSGGGSGCVVVEGAPAAVAVLQTRDPGASQITQGVIDCGRRSGGGGGGGGGGAKMRWRDASAGVIKE